jgi:hypothetical protein
MRFIKACFWRKNGGILQKNRGIREIILHFFSRFSAFSGFSPSQAIALQGQASLQPLQNKSYLKSYRRFSACPTLCHNRRMKVELTGRSEGCRGWTAMKRRSASREAFWSAERQFRFRTTRRRAVLVRGYQKLQFSPGSLRPVQASTSQYK